MNSEKLLKHILRAVEQILHRLRYLVRLFLQHLLIIAHQADRARADRRARQHTAEDTFQAAALLLLAVAAAAHCF